MPRFSMALRQKVDGRYFEGDFDFDVQSVDDIGIRRTYTFNDENRWDTFPYEVPDVGRIAFHVHVVHKPNGGHPCLPRPKLFVDVWTYTLLNKATLPDLLIAIGMHVPKL
jgi:hypothetical protein